MSDDKPVRVTDRPQCRLRIALLIAFVASLVLTVPAALAAAELAADESAFDELAADEPDADELAAVARIGGSFVQPYLADSWSPRQWRREMRLMRYAGLDTLVLQWTADTGSRTTVYPSALEGYTRSTSSDIVERALTNGDRTGIGVYLGLNVNDAWWNTSVHDRAWFRDEMRTGNAIMDELWAKYGHHRSLRGWYVAFEPWNETLDASALKNLIEGFRSVADHAHGTTHLPIMVAPFFSDHDGQGPVDFGGTWETILRQAPVDIVAMQDGIGVGHTTVERLAPWFRAMRHAISESRPSTRLWSDTETFTLDDGRTMPINGIIDDLRAVRPYVSKSLSFSFNHYISPQQVDPLYDRTYLLWARAGRRDMSAPAPGSGLVATPGGPLAINLTWGVATDDIGVVGYRLYRDGISVGGTVGGVTVFTDNQLDPGTTHSYTFTAYDAAGNASAQSGLASATVAPTPVYPTNLAFGRPYAVDIPADPGYPDDGGTELTDGVHGTADFTDPAWQGRLVNLPYSIALDLGSVQPIGEIVTTWLQVLSAAINLPPELTYATSDDGKTWMALATIARPAVSMADQSKRYVATALTGVAGRYVRVTVSSANWSFIDELEVRH